MVPNGKRTWPAMASRAVNNHKAMREAKMAITCLGGGTAASLLTWPQPPLRNAWPPDETW
jgi:uncharacterized membrane protein YccC